MATKNMNIHNPRKRKIEQTMLNGHRNTTKPPPSKKQRIQPPNFQKDHPETWSIDQLKRYLEKHSVTYQLKQNLPYYAKLVDTHKLRRNASNSNSKYQNSDYTMVSSDESSSQGQSPDELQTNHHNGNASQSPQIQQVTSQATPPLPTNLIRVPLNEDVISDEPSESASNDFRIQKNDDNDNNDYKSTPTYETPSTLKTKSLIQPSTPISPLVSKLPTLKTKTKPRSQPLFNQPTMINDNPYDSNMKPMNKSSKIIQSGNGSYVSNAYIPSSTEPATEPTNTNTDNNNNNNNHTPQVQDDDEQVDVIPANSRIGPFQDIPQFTRQVCAKVSKFPSVNVNVNVGKFDSIPEKYRFAATCIIAIIIILFSMSIPYFIAWNSPTPYCDNGQNKVANYSVLNGIIPLESIINCNACPYDATSCSGGKATCQDDYSVDKYGVICIPDNNIAAINGSDIAYQANEILRDWVCKFDGEYVPYKVTEDELITALKLKFDIKSVQHEDDTSDKTEDISNNADHDDNIENNDDNDDNDANDTTDTNDDIDTNEILTNQFNQGWVYAKDNIIPKVYDTQIVYDDELSLYHGLQPKSSLLCKTRSLYHQLRNINFDFDYDYDFNFDFEWGFAFYIINVSCTILIILSGLKLYKIDIVSYFKEYKYSSKKTEAEALKAKEFVIHKLSQQPNLHFSIDQIRSYTMRKLQINEYIWNKCIDLIRESDKIEIIREECEGSQRLCWKWCP